MQESSYNRLLSQAEQSAQAITSDQLEQWFRDMETTTLTLRTATRNKEHQLPHQTTQTTTRRKQFRRQLYNMGVSTGQVRTRQQDTTTGCNQDCNPAQRDKRSTTIVFVITSRQYHNLRTNQITGCGVSQSSITIRQTTSGYE